MRIALLLLAPLASVGCHEPGAPTDDDFEARSGSSLDLGGAEAEKSPYRHPLRDAVLPTGEIPLLDVKDSPTGKRYAIGDVAMAPDDGDGPPELFSGVLELDL
jgi:hypothetical protein